MRKAAVSMFVSMDGVKEQPDWTWPHCNEEIAKFKFDELASNDTLLLGRVTYEGFTVARPGHFNHRRRVCTR